MSLVREPSVSEHKEKPKLPLCSYPGFPDGIPETIVVTEESKSNFGDARLAETKEDKIEKGQGMVDIAFRGKDLEGNEVLFIEKLSAFNRDDNKPKKDKFDNDLKIFVESKEKLGSNSGTVHEDFLEIIKEKAIKAMIEGTAEEKQRYCYIIKKTADKNEYEIDRTQMFGFGSFKGNDKILLHQFRNKSANINSKSVKYSPIFLHAFWFYKPHEKKSVFEREYYITRSLPIPLTNKLSDAELKQLPLEDKDTARALIDTSEQDNAAYEKEWDAICDNPDEVIKKLRYTLCRFAENGDRANVNNVIQSMRDTLDQLCPTIPEEEKLARIATALNYHASDDNKTALMIAIGKGNLGLAQDLCASGASLNAYNSKDQTLLIQAIEKNDIKTIRNFIDFMKTYLDYSSEKVAEIINFIDNSNKSALDVAIRLGHQEISELLISHGATANKLWQKITLELDKNSDEKTIINMLDVKETKETLDSDEFLDKTALGQLLYSATEKGYGGLVKALINRGATNDANPANGMTPLHLAAQHGYTQIVEAILTIPSVSINSSVDGSKETPLLLAIKNGHIDLAQKIMANPDANSYHKNNKDETPLLCAVEKNQTEIVQKLLKNAPTSGPVTIYTKNYAGNSPYSIAAKTSPSTEISKLILESHQENCKFALLTLKSSIEKTEWKIENRKHKTIKEEDGHKIKMPNTVHKQWLAIKKAEADSKNVDWADLYIQTMKNASDTKNSMAKLQGIDEKTPSTEKSSRKPPSLFFKLAHIKTPTKPVVRAYLKTLLDAKDPIQLKNSITTKGLLPQEPLNPSLQRSKLPPTSIRPPLEQDDLPPPLEPSSPKKTRGRARNR